MEKSPPAVYDAIHSLGVRWFEPRHARPNFNRDATLMSWYKDVDDASKALVKVYGHTESEGRDLAARDEVESILARYGSKIWGENPQCFRLVAGENDYFLHELLYPRDRERLLEKHMQLFRIKWSKWKPKAQSAAKPTWQEIEDDDDADSLDSRDYVPSSDDETLDTVEQIERPQRNKRTRWSFPSNDSGDLDIIDVQPLKSIPPSSNKKAAGGDRVGGASGSASTKKPKKVRNVCLPCRKRHIRCDEGIPSCQNCLRLDRACERAPPRTSRSSNSVRKHDSSVTCPFGDNCPRMVKAAFQDHEKVYHFSCSACREVFPATNLEAHKSFGHDSWDLLPLDPKKAGTIYHNVSQRPFHAQGYWLSTDRVRKLRLSEARSILQVREQVDETVLVVNVEGSRRVERVNFQHCYSFENLAFRIAHAADVDPQKIELLHVMLPYDFDYDVEPGDCHIIAANDENTFKDFISMLEGSWRCNDGEPRTLLFLCKVFLRLE